MDELRQKLAPLTDWIPGGLRDRLPVEGWWGILFGVALLGMVLLWLLLRGLMGGGQRKKVRVRAEEAGEDLGRYPPLQRPPGANVATVYHVPARLRLVVMAPVGKGMTIDPAEVEKMLDQIVPGLGQVARDDKPRILVWPAQISHHGFGATFQRTTRKPEAEGEPSHWIVVAGRAQVGKVPLALGLALSADQPNTVGRLNIELHQWLDVLRLRPSK